MQNTDQEILNAKEELFKAFLEMHARKREEAVREKVTQSLFVHKKGRPRKVEIKELKKTEEYKAAVEKALLEDERASAYRNGDASLVAEEREKFNELFPHLVKDPGDAKEYAKAIAALAAADDERKRKAEEHAEESIREEEKNRLLESVDLDEEMGKIADDFMDGLDEELKGYLATHELELVETDWEGSYRGWPREPIWRSEPVTSSNIGEFLKGMLPGGELWDDECGLMHITKEIGDFEDFFSDYLIAEFDRRHPGFRDCGAAWEVHDAVAEAACDNDGADFYGFFSEHFDEERILRIMSFNPHHAAVARRELRMRREEEEAREAILKEIPENYADIYPKARSMKRKFILHIGPTNSHKTHDAVEDMLASGSGVYLAPLRLLAYEQYEAVSGRGIPCDMVTGEERIYTPGARFACSTVEMADLSGEYEAAVIDEAQMAADPDRGGAWTEAILGLRAGRIHLCASPDAEDLLLSLVSLCGDSAEVVRHERKTPLRFERDLFLLPEDAAPGDALVVFSRRHVHGVAAELQAAGRKCSVIYGALPYESRHEEAEKFRSGENEVLVATDAIGMGMNLPIRRVVFLEFDKFDGRSSRRLLPEEAKQIAGRAGREGMFDEGIVNSGTMHKEVGMALRAGVRKKERASVKFPRSLLSLEGPASSLLAMWGEIPAADGFEKAPVDREIMLARWLEEICDDKHEVYALATMPFNEKDEELLDAWKAMARSVVSGRQLYIPDYFGDEGADDLADLEAEYRFLDLAWRFADGYGTRQQADEVMRRKKEAAGAITEELSKQRLKGKECRECGRSLPWSYPYPMCQKCHDMLYPPRYYDYDDDYDDEDDFFF